jgi:predicted Ser/Thr protein kinase
LRLARAVAARGLNRFPPAGLKIDPALENWLLDNLADGRVVGRGYQAIVRQLSGAAGELVVKSPHPNPFLAWFGRRAIRREANVYARLAGIPGVPGCFGLARGEHLVLAHVPGPTLRQVAHSLEDRERFFARLLETILAMHAAGVAHGDLKRKDNTLVGPDERPFIIDFGIASVLMPATSAWGRRRFELTRQVDLNAWIKLKHGTRPENLPPDEAPLYRPLAIERWARRMRPHWQWLTLRRARKRRRELENNTTRR